MYYTIHTHYPMSKVKNELSFHYKFKQIEKSLIILHGQGA